MTPTQHSGYDAQKTNQIDPDLSRADTPAGREYRDGMRQARREAEDGMTEQNAGSVALPEQKAPEIKPATPNAFAEPEPTAKRARKSKPVYDGQGKLFS